MALTEVITGTDVAVTPGAGSAFITTGRGFWLCSDYFKIGECAWLMKTNSSGDWIPVRDSNGAVVVSETPNTLYVDVPPGTYRLGKTASIEAVAVWIEEE